MSNNNFYQLSTISSTNNSYYREDYDETNDTNNVNNGNNGTNKDIEEEDDIYEELNDDNYDFIEFKENVKEWLSLDDDIITLQNAIKERKSRKVELTPKIMLFMDEYKINDLNTNNGKIKFTKSMYTKPLNKQYLISKLTDYLRDNNKGEKAAMFIMENRDKQEKSQLRRVRVKKQINI